MNFWTNCSIKTVVALLALLIGGCSPLPRAAGVPDRGGVQRVAILPLENLSTATAPTLELRQNLRGQLQAGGIDLLPETELEAFMARHRVRWSGGIDRATAEAFRRETGAEAILVTTLTLYHPEISPRIGMAARLVTAEQAPILLWSDSVDLAGDDAPGLLDLGLITDMQELQEIAMARLTTSLLRHLDGQALASPGGRNFRPKVHFRAAEMPEGPNLTVAILPFMNQSDKRSAGDLMALHFLRHLQSTGTIQVLEPGVLREELLRLRLILPDGASLDTADLLFQRLNVDLLLSGKVTSYDDGAAGPRVAFTVEAIARRSRRVVWSSQSENRGHAGVYFFALGKVNTAQELASRMTGEVVRLLALPPPKGHFTPLSET